MEQLLALYNIKTVQFLDNENVVRQYAFNDKMLANNIFIEYYSIDPDEDDDGIDVEDIEDAEYGSQLSVIMEYRGKCYQFLMFHETFEIGVPVMLLQTIIFLANLIEKARPDQLVVYLNSIATDPLIPHEIPDKEFAIMANKMLELKIETIHALIQGRKAGLN